MSRTPSEQTTEPVEAVNRRVPVAYCAERLGLSGATVIKRIEAGELPAIRSGRVYRVWLSDLADYEEKISTVK